MCFQLSNMTQFDSWTFQQSFWSMDFMDWDSHFVFNPKDSRSKIYVEVYDGIVSILNLETRCSSSAASQIQWWVPTVLFFFWDFFWRSGLLEYWIQSYVRGHCFGCSLRHGMPFNSPCKLANFTWIWTYKTQGLTDYQLTVCSVLPAITTLSCEVIDKSQDQGWPWFFNCKYFPLGPPWSISVALLFFEVSSELSTSIFCVLIRLCQSLHTVYF